MYGEAEITARIDCPRIRRKSGHDHTGNGLARTASAGNDRITVVNAAVSRDHRSSHTGKISRIGTCIAARCFSRRLRICIRICIGILHGATVAAARLLRRFRRRIDIDRLLHIVRRLAVIIRNRK